jgi:hypothetical protein
MKWPFCFLFCGLEIQSRDCGIEFAHAKQKVLHYCSEVPMFVNKCFIQSCILYQNWEACRFWRVLTMVCDTQNYWVFGLCPSSGILEARRLYVSETVSVSNLRCGVEMPILLNLLERATFNHQTTPISISVLCYDRWSVSQSILE